jgi:DNA primase
MVGSVTDEIKQRVDVVELISRYTQLKRAGSIYKGLCPFHGERTPSFVVFPNSGTWHCFGACGTGGDVISFVMRKENLDFREAVELLAKQAGIEISERDEDRSGQQRAQIYDANEAAATFFTHVLNHHPAAESARLSTGRRCCSARPRAARGLVRPQVTPEYSNRTPRCTTTPTGAPRRASARCCRHVSWSRPSSSALRPHVRRSRQPS